MINLLTATVHQISPEGIIDRYPNSYNHFVLPFVIGITFILIYLFIGLIRILYHLSGEDRIKLLKSLFNPKTAWKNIKDIFCDCLLHTKIWKEGKFSTAEYVANVIRGVLDYAVFKQIIVVNPLKGISKYLPKAETKHYQSFNDVTLESDMKGLFQAFSTQDRKLQCLLFMYFFTLLRSNELRTVKFDNYFGDCLVVKTKTLDEFKVPLSPQAQKVMQYMIKHHQNEKNPYIFEGTAEDGILSKNTLNKALSSLGYKDKLRVHGIRTCGRQYMQLIPTAKESIIELCLSHVAGNQVQQAYNRGDYYTERERIMRIWCDFVESCIGEHFAFVAD